MGEREQIINFLLQSCDQKIAMIEVLKKANADLQKQVVALSPKDVSAPAPVESAQAEAA